MQPREDDVVLGNNTAIPIEAVVLGGLEGVRQRLSSNIIAQRVAALKEAQQYGRDGIELIIRGLQDRSLQVQKAAYLLLQHRSETIARRSLQAYDAYPLFECLVTLTGHPKDITAVAIAPQQQTVISSSRDGTIHVWDWLAQAIIFTMRTRRPIFAISVSPDGETFTARDREQTVQAWCLRTGRSIFPEEQHPRSIASVTVTADHHLISGSQNLIRIWNLAVGREVCTLKGHTSLVTAVAVSGDRQLIVSGSEDRTVRVWGVGH